MQAKLLRVLEDKKISRLGGSGEVAVDVRILAASNRPLERAIREGRLRADLYYRLCVFPIELPPLRDRLDDVPLLAEEFIRAFNLEHRKAVQGIASDCLDALNAHHWPGNVRELRNTIERAVIVSKAPMLSVGDLSTTLASQPGSELGFMVRLGSTLEEVESELIARTISFAGGNKSRAAEILGVGRRTLYKQPDRYKAYETNGHSNGRPPRNGRNGLT